MKLLSIITINYNDAAGLEATIASVISQTYREVEFIVIDGGSADESKTLLEKYQQDIAYSVSEKDKGIYNAMNKGIDAATGKYLLFLNSGDVLSNNTVLETIVPSLQDADIVYGDLLIKEPAKEWVKHYNERLTFEYFMRDTLPHQGSFISRDLLIKAGKYDEGLKIVADWKFFLDAVCRYEAATKYVPLVITVYDYTGISSRPEYFEVQLAEKKKVLLSGYPLHADSYSELEELRYLKRHFEDLTKNFFVRKIFALQLKSRAISGKFKKLFKK
ncbi:glycosyltransferase family 2 protein [Ferruginibacter sp. HRS2-29]|uniref:glycosyltransferase family 2 protein n=1 Tax=Ferruginibacter sp. HRS2-29 TaxID=2487334 RepID=UPI0020CE3F94|nr:glycosyltransferase family 2 protein [Ferruginibacter sp. HRS2-29]